MEHERLCSQSADGNREVLLDEAVEGKLTKRPINRSGSYNRLLEERGNPHADGLGRSHGIYYDNGRINHDAMYTAPSTSNTLQQQGNVLKIPGLIMGVLLGFLAGETVVTWVLAFLAPPA